jgi:hypothetical protein
MEACAQTLGLTFEENGASLLDQGIAEVPIFVLARLQQGSIRNLMRGSRAGFTLAICDYHYWTGNISGSSQRFDYTQTIFCFRCSGTSLPDFALVPRRGEWAAKLISSQLRLHRAAAAAMLPSRAGTAGRVLQEAVAASQDAGIRFDAHPQFSSWYTLTSAAEDEVRRIFDPGVITFLEEHALRDYHIQKAGDWLVVFQKKVQIAPQDLGVALDVACLLRARFSPPEPGS